MLKELQNQIEKYSRILEEHELENKKIAKSRIKSIWIELRKTIIEFNQSL